MVVLLSANANESNFVCREVERAASKRKTINVLRIEDVKPSEDIEFYISICQWLDMFGSHAIDPIKILIVFHPELVSRSN